ncbi:MAG: carboxypeptidase M32 [Candidatus Cardinium sp.]|nr:carboxypeptidase M32 [Candidatus Cardinium sp.]
MSLYKDFIEKFSHIQLLRQIEQLLEWDQQVCMPAAAVEIRSKQLAYLASLLYKETTSAAYRDALEAMIDINTENIKIKDLSFTEAANLREWARDFKRMTKLTKSFIQTYYTVVTKATEVWKEAKKTANFALFSPWLQKVVALNQEKANLLGYTTTPYDALLDLYEPGITTEDLSSLFSDLEYFLLNKVKRTSGKNSPYEVYFEGSFAQADLMSFNQLILDSLGLYNNHNSRVDFSVHPFCMGIHPTDVRFTIHKDNGLLENIFATLHEGGHALYELGLSKEEWATPAGQAASMGLHESQSRWWEVMVGKSLPFWKYFYPKFQMIFPQFKQLALSDFYQHINHIRPSCVRIYADEITYPLHIILRFKLEKQLIEGTIEVDDVPHLWNDEMKRLLGITPTNDAEGCLQDIHWSSGSFGYFPTYALGNIYAAQCFHAFEQSFPTWEENIATGKFSFMRDWLRERIHQFGRVYSVAQIIQSITGTPIAVQSYKEYITQKYTNLAVF